MAVAKYSILGLCFQTAQGQLVGLSKLHVPGTTLELHSRDIFSVSGQETSLDITFIEYFHSSG